MTLRAGRGQIDSDVFDVRRFVARGDNATYDTAAIRAAAAALAKNGGGVLLFPAGGLYLAGYFKTL